MQPVLPAPLTTVSQLNSYKQIYLYGYGHTGRRVLAFLQSHNIYVSGITDTHLTTSDGLMPLNEIAVASSRESLIIICSYNMTYAIQISQAIEDSGFKGDAMWNALDFPYEKIKSKCISASPSFIDGYSLNLFTAILNCFEHQSNLPLCQFKNEHPITCEAQYLDILGKTRIKSMLDIGVFDGSELVNFWRGLDNLHSYTGIDPFGTSKLINDAKNICNANSCNILALAIGKDEGTVSFHDEGPGSFINQNENCSIKLSRVSRSSTTVRLTTLDSLFFSGLISPVDFLKIDIEGGEVDALLGAQKYLKSNVKIIAISVYHQYAHFSQIPLLLSDLGFKYQYLRSYTPSPIDTILYCYNELFFEELDMQFC